MLAMLLCIVAVGNDYASAYSRAQAENIPLVVVVGAEWCPACVNYKNTTIKTMLIEGELQEVAYAYVDQDLEPELAAQIKREPTIPQTVIYYQSNGVWCQDRSIGYKARRPLLDLLQRIRNKMKGKNE